MRQTSWDRVDQWWAALFGCSVTDLWDSVAVGPHAGLGDYPGVLVAHRGGSCQVSLPSWCHTELQDSLSQQGVSALGDAQFWSLLPATSGMAVLGPSVHSYTDDDPGTSTSAHPCEWEELDDLRRQLPESEWNEGGFADDALELFAIRDRHGHVVAAANLTDFLGTAADVGVVVHPAHRGRGLGREVGTAATSHAVAHHGIARWRARVTNAPSRAAAARLGFEPYCRQLAVRP